MSAMAESKGAAPAPEPPTPKFTTRTPLASPLAESGWKTSAYFGLHLFDKQKLLAAVDTDTATAFKSALDNATPVPLSAADVIAKAILKWATGLGATHYTHWFQPLTAVTAEKHDTFMDLKRDGNAITRFEGKHLVRGEPDGSSFPSGGLRATHCARGYTAWDPSSPPFVLDNGNGTTLYIPAVFFSWADNQALDDKIPLLRSEIALARESLTLLHEIGEPQHTIFKCDSGLEQEYFLIDRQFYLKRPDLVLANRTLMGAAPPKGQQMDDHYFAATSRRFQDLIHEFEVSMWRLGIPLQTRHKEVAPGQYEVAPRFAEASVATDRNLLMMSQLKAIATKHGMAALLHEKPFKGVNGSGKHNNWSFGTNCVGSLLEPGDNPERDNRFMLFLAAVLRGLDIHSDLMRIAISGAGNDHRLGANEAPPAIVSAYLGDDIDLAVKKFVRGDKSPPTVELKVDLGVGFLPPLTRAATDRNRTSTFAFTGNKFEFRAVGSSQTPSRSNQILNTMLADSIRHMTGQIKALKAGGMSNVDAVEKVARDTLVAHERIIFNGNGYSAEWPIEAKRRGLLNLRTTPDALALYATDKNIRLHESLGVLTRAELVARSHVFYEEYVKRIDLEARVFNSMTLTGVVPAAVDYAVRLGLLSNPGPAVLALAGRVRAATEAALNGTTAITRALHDLHTHEAVEKSARHAESVLLPLITSTRDAVDELETLLPADKWPFPTYHDMLFNQE